MRERSRFDWVELIEGILLILLGFYSISHPGSALTGVVLLYGLVAIVTGIADIVFYVKVEEHTGFGPTVSLVSGVLSVDVYKRQLKDTKPGDIILLHDYYQSSVDAALGIVDALTERGYKFVTVDELILE